MKLSDINTNFPLDEVFALVFFFMSWFYYSFSTAKKAMNNKQGILAVMHDHRLSWMKGMVKRENRLSDINAVGNLMRSISFFASTTVLIIVAIVSVLGNHEKMNSVIGSIPFSTQTSPLFWEVKIAVMAILFIFAFFKFTWSLRQYNYLNVIIIGAPHPTQPKEFLEQYADKAAELATNAARHFGYGLRAYYFALAVLSWFVSSYLFIIATVWTIWVLYRREFKSRTLHYISRQEG